MRKAAALAGFLLLQAGCAPQRMEAPTCPDTPSGANYGGPVPVAQDDGYDTYLTFPGRMAMPAISAIGQDGVERAVNTTRDPDTGKVTVHGVFPKIVLREGSRVACLVNPAYDPIGVRPRT